MSFPLYMNDAFGYATAMALGTLLGVGFGFVLERSGFGRARILAAQFYGTDMRVFKVMFSAIVTATVGLGILTGVGVVDAAALSIPETFVGPHVIGGLILGAGFIVSGYCPGTAVVATASGNVDAIWSLVGVMAGGLIFGAAWPAVEGFYFSGAQGVMTLPDLLGLPWAAVAAGVALMAIGAFIGAEKVETWLAGREGRDDPNRSHGVRNRVFGAFAAVAAAGVGVVAAMPSAEVTAPSVNLAPITAAELAVELVSDPSAYYIVDLRPPELCAEERIPGAMCLSPDDPDGAFLATLPATRRLVIYGQSEVPTPPQSLAAFGGLALALEGGYDAFHDDILHAPPPPGEFDSQTLETFKLRQALYNHYTGQSSSPALLSIKPKAVKRSVKKGGGC